MIYWDTGVVTRIIDHIEDTQTVEVRLNSGNLSKAIHYTDELPLLQTGDFVQLNATARVLQLGTGGYDFVYSVIDRSPNLTPWFEGSEPSQPNGHLMKMRYTPMQKAVYSAEEQESPHHELFNDCDDLKQIPVLIGELHSMLPAAVLYLKQQLKKSNLVDKKIVYIMSDGGALPLVWSRHVQYLKQDGIQGTVTYGHAYGGDIEAVNKYTALIAAKYILKADIIIATMGPGISGTGTKWGFSGTEVGEVINAVAALKGVPIVIPRLSFQDPRKRHYGLSHHTLTCLSKIALASAIVPLPSSISDSQKAYIDQQIKALNGLSMHDYYWVDICIHELSESYKSYPETITTMNRDLNKDPEFFLGVAAASQYALNRLRKDVSSP